MGRSPCCDEKGLKKGPWMPEEDEKLKEYIRKHGHGSWRALPKLAGLNRCGKSCRLRWTNYLRPDIKRGNFTSDEEQTIINLHALLGNKWSAIATHLPGRTDNEIKNFWNTHLRKKLLQMGIDPVTHRPRTDHLNLLQLLAASNFNNLLNNINSFQFDATVLAKVQLLQNMIQVLSNNSLAMAGSSGGGGGSNSSLLLGQCSSGNRLISEYLKSINDGNIGSLFEFPSLQDPSLVFLDNDQNPDPKDNQNHHLGMCSSLNPTVVQDQNSIPPLVSDSSEDFKHTQMMIKNKDKHKVMDDNSNPSSTSTHTHEANWGDIMDDEASDSIWKDIMEQACSESWPFSD